MRNGKVDFLGVRNSSTHLKVEGRELVLWESLNSQGEKNIGTQVEKQLCIFLNGLMQEKKKMFHLKCLNMRKTFT